MSMILAAILMSSSLAAEEAPAALQQQAAPATKVVEPAQPRTPPTRVSWKPVVEGKGGHDELQRMEAAATQLEAMPEAWVTGAAHPPFEDSWEHPIWQVSEVSHLVDAEKLWWKPTDKAIAHHTKKHKYSEGSWGQQVWRSNYHLTEVDGATLVSFWTKEVIVERGTHTEKTDWLVTVRDGHVVEAFASIDTGFSTEKRLVDFAWDGDRLSRVELYTEANWTEGDVQKLVYEPA